MARASARILDSGDRFPRLVMETVGHGRIELPDWFGGRWGVLLVYRAHW
jgi:alkyl hydroperoxide reductase subunit AhpC